MPHDGTFVYFKFKFNINNQLFFLNLVSAKIPTEK